MSGYFSRLIQQTGIALGTSKVSSGADLQEAIAPQIGSEFVPIQIEENQEIGNQEAQEEEFKLRYSTIVKNGQDTRSTKSEFLGGVGKEPALVESQFLTSQADENPLSQVEIESSSPRLEAQKTRDQEQEVESLSVQFTSSQNAIAAENFPELPKSYHQEPNEITKEPTADSRFTKYTPDRDIPVGTRQCRVPTTPTRKINLQSVLEWVAETPEENLNSQFPIPNSQQHDTEVTETRIAILSDARSPIPDAQFPIPNSQFPNYPVQKNPNFVLSIGTISLTVEAPQSEVKKPPLPPVKSQQEVKPVNQTSRLSRHYIR